MPLAIPLPARPVQAASRRCASVDPRTEESTARVVGIRGDELAHLARKPGDVAAMLDRKRVAAPGELQLVGERQLAEIAKCDFLDRIFRQRESIDEPQW